MNCDHKTTVPGPFIPAPLGGYTGTVICTYCSAWRTTSRVPSPWKHGPFPEGSHGTGLKVNK